MKRLWYSMLMPSQRMFLVAMAGLAAVIAATAPAVADGPKHKQVRYIGIHPIPKDRGGGLCYLEAPHVHVYAAPSATVQFRDHRGAQFFTGDPVAYGWDGPRQTYMGHHPIYVNAVLGDPEPHQEFCFLDGPHFHAFAPPATVSADFRIEGGAYFFIGTPPPSYLEVRPAMAEINAIYQPIVYERPVVTIAPPQAWIGIRYPVVVVEHGHGRGRGNAYGHGHVGVGIAAPSLSVDVALPSVSIGVGAGVMVGGGVGVVGGGGGGHRGSPKHGKRGHRD